MIVIRNRKKEVLILSNAKILKPCKGAGPNPLTESTLATYEDGSTYMVYDLQLETVTNMMVSNSSYIFEREWVHDPLIDA